MNDLYYLFDTESKKHIGKVVTLNQKEVSKLNYAYALNGSNLRYWDSID